MNRPKTECDNQRDRNVAQSQLHPAYLLPRLRQLAVCLDFGQCSLWEVTKLPAGNDIVVRGRGPFVIDAKGLRDH